MNSDFALSAYLWDCNDNECGCTQPIVEVRSTHPWSHPAWKTPKRIAEGPYKSDHEGPTTEQERWLEEAIDWYHLCEARR